MWCLFSIRVLVNNRCSCKPALAWLIRTVAAAELYATRLGKVLLCAHWRKGAQAGAQPGVQQHSMPTHAAGDGRSRKLVGQFYQRLQPVYVLPHNGTSDE